MEIEQKTIRRVMRLVGRKEETAAVLIGGLGVYFLEFLPMLFSTGSLFSLFSSSGFIGSSTETMYDLDSSLYSGSTQHIITHSLKSNES